MWERATILFAGCMGALLLPFVITMSMTGVLSGELVPLAAVDSGKVSTVCSVCGTASMDLEMFLVLVLSAQISPDCQEEALKAQAVIARITLKTAMEANSIADSSTLNVEYLTMEECKSQWGKKRYDKYLKRLENAVVATYGQTLSYENAYIDAMYHGTSMGNTISSEEAYGRAVPYLTELSCSQDVESPDYMEVSMYSWEDMTTVLNTLNNQGLLAGFSMEQTAALPLADRLKVESSTSHGYVQSVSVGGILVDGDAFAAAAGLQSHVYYIEAVAEQYRIVCLGKGHGLGLSQYTANIMTKEGTDYAGILEYLYPSNQLGT